MLTRLAVAVCVFRCRWILSCLVSWLLKLKLPRWILLLSLISMWVCYGCVGLGGVGLLRMTMLGSVFMLFLSCLRLTCVCGTNIALLRP